MIFTRMGIEGAYIIEPEPLTDERGFFARSFCKEEFQRNGLESRIVQCNISSSKRAGTLRGMHYQIPPFEEAKIVSCIRGSIYDVVLDLRRGSSTYRRWSGMELSENNYTMVYVPKGCAHGFLTLEDDCVVYYQMTEFFHPEYARGVRWDDLAFGITWPHPAEIISEKDQNYPDYAL